MNLKERIDDLLELVEMLKSDTCDRWTKPVLSPKEQHEVCERTHKRICRLLADIYRSDDPDEYINYGMGYLLNEWMDFQGIDKIEVKFREA